MNERLLAAIAVSGFLVACNGLGEQRAESAPKLRVGGITFPALPKSHDECEPALQRLVSALDAFARETKVPERLTEESGLSAAARTERRKAWIRDVVIPWGAERSRRIAEMERHYHGIPSDEPGQRAVGAALLAFGEFALREDWESLLTHQARWLTTEISADSAEHPHNADVRAYWSEHAARVVVPTREAIDSLARVCMNQEGAARAWQDFCRTRFE